MAAYSAFVPVPLPPREPSLIVDDEMLSLLSKADRELGRLDGAASNLPNVDLFIAMYVRHESVLSSQIEGTQSTLDEILEWESDPDSQTKSLDVEETVNYVAALNHGLKRLAEIPLSTRLLLEMHRILMRGVRGENKSPGEYRRNQNWIGGSGPSAAAFVPPAPDDMVKAMSDLEKFLHDRGSFSDLIHTALVHAQFETIHPFNDGNGRLGRLLITLQLCEREILAKPLLYLSYFFKANRTEYFDRLMAVRMHGQWEEWVKFFLRGVAEVSRVSTLTIRAISEMWHDHRSMAASLGGSTLTPRLIEFLFRQPIVTIKGVKAALLCSYPAASNAVKQLESLGLLEEVTGQKRFKRYRYAPYLALFNMQTIKISGELGPIPPSSSEANAPHNSELWKIVRRHRDMLHGWMNQMPVDLREVERHASSGDEPYSDEGDQGATGEPKSTSA